MKTYTRNTLYSSPVLFLCIALALFVLTTFIPFTSADDSVRTDQDQGVSTNVDKSLEDGDDRKKDNAYSTESDEESKSKSNGGEEAKTDGAQKNETFDWLYAEGIKAYTNQLWYSCAFKIEDALKDYKAYANALTKCRVECNDGIRLYKLSNISSNVEEFSKFFTFLKVADCFRRCKEDLIGKRNPVSTEIEEAFEDRSPYMYLQFCYFKLDKLKLAASSVYTYYLSHPDDEDAKKNIQFYRDELKVPESDFQDMEMTPFKEHYIMGLLAYSKHDWLEMIKHMELSIEEYMKDIPACHANCYGRTKLTDPDFMAGIADAITRLMMCQIECETKQSVVYSEPIPFILQSILHHLQFAYYNVQDYEKCAETIESFLLLNASHEVMRKNKDSIKSLLRYEGDDFVPRKEIQLYAFQHKEMIDTMDFINKNYKWPDGIQVDEAIEYDDIMSELNDEPDEWMSRYEMLGMHIIAKASDLHRKDRFVTDGMLKPEQCDELKALLEQVPYDSSNVKFFNFRTAQKALKENPDEEFETSLRLLIRASDIIRFYTERFILPDETIHIKHASIVCQKPHEGKLNCYPQADGSCIKFDEMSDELSAGLFTTVTYLNDVDDDGDFNFLSEKKEKDGSFGIRCGRTVGFNSDDRHSLNIPRSQERCAFLIRYTTNKNDHDKEIVKTIVMLKRVEELRRALLNVSTEEVMKSFAEKGVKIVKNGTDLKGKERFVADGLATSAQCNSLKNLVQSAALAGDGYDHLTKKPSLISPHTENEMFMGIDIYRSSKLFHAGMISSVAFRTLLELSDDSRLLVEKYFNLPYPLYFDYTHLVCRTARDDNKMNREDLSHPVHADNCILKPNGSCTKEFPAFIQREYSAILYMNEDFQGGEFFFAHSNKTEQVSVRPKCGRIVGFSAGEFHGVRAVLSGQRCALALWFTSDPNFKELAHFHARKVLKEKEKLKESSTVAVHEDL